MTRRIAIAELEGAALDWAVAKAIGKTVKLSRYISPAKPGVIEPLSGVRFQPTTNWSQCGPLIERYKVDLSYHEEYMANDGKGPVWEAMLADLWLAPADEYDPIGKTPLIAACRAIVAAHNPSGFVEVPDELVEGE